VKHSHSFLLRFPLGLLFGLSAGTGCMVFDREINATSMPGCTTNAECTTQMSAGGTTVPAVCIHDEAPHCVQITSPDCTVVTGDYTDDDALLIGSLLSTTGAQAATNIPRQQAAMMAVQDINASNASGGILQSAAPGDTRKLVMVSCDEVANFPRVTTHLISELRVPAIVGPNLSQHVLDLTIGNPAMGVPSAAQAGTALLTPAAVAAAIATVPDNGLSFMMVPSDIQRVPLLKARINAVEAQLKAARQKSTIKLGVWYRNDALGEGTRDGLTSLTINGGTLANAINTGRARQDGYDLTSTDNSAAIQNYLAFKPDIIVIIGTAEAITYFVNPLEAAWQAAMPAVPKPYYIAIDSTKVPDLLTAVTGNDDLRMRWSGTGVAPPAESLAVFNAFQIAYGQRFKDGNGNPQPATQSGMGPAYDAVYTIALALVGKHEFTGASIIAGMPRLSTNTAACTYDASGIEAPCFTVTDHRRTLYTNMAALLNNAPVTEIGTFGRLEWDDQGNKSSGLIEVWCIDATGPKPIYASSGLTYDVKTQSMSGQYTQCAP
jgi:ABC-type branched-subunit amino acid transport system substrate-binding protein